MTDTSTIEIVNNLTKRLNKLELKFDKEKQMSKKTLINYSNDITWLQELNKETNIKISNIKNRFQYISFYIQINQKYLELLILNIENLNPNIKLQDEFYKEIENTQKDLLTDDMISNEIDEVSTQLNNEFNVKYKNYGFYV